MIPLSILASLTATIGMCSLQAAGIWLRDKITKVDDERINKVTGQLSHFIILSKRKVMLVEWTQFYA